MISYLEHSFYKDNSGRIVESTNGHYKNRQFYEAEGDYYLMNTCNKWTAKGLRSAGLDISPTFKLTASSIMDYLSKHTEALMGKSCKPSGLPH